MNTKFGDLIRKVNVTQFPVECGGRAFEMSPCSFWFLGEQNSRSRLVAPDSVIE